MTLSEEHRDMLEVASAIDPAVIEERGYRTVESKAELERLGFARPQRNTPTLLIPLWGVTGEIVLYHHRPDTSRVNDGKRVKYEFPHGAKMAIDVHPRLKEKIRDPGVPLVITEGVKKADAAVSRGICCISVVGVYNWRGTNEHGGKTALPDWEGIALKDRSDYGRDVYIAFDSDAMTKKEVYGALTRLSAFLRLRGARVAFLYLPTGEGGAKTGLDDYFATGRTCDDLFQLATTELRKPPEDPSKMHRRALPYRATPYGIVWDKAIQDDSVEVPLTNFTARIVADETEDDGAETRRVYSIEARVAGGAPRTFELPAESFVAMNWPSVHLGSRAILFPGQSLRDHARTAIQSLSDAEERRVRTHVGWMQADDGSWRYCHAGGTIGAPVGEADGIQVRLSDRLGRYSLPTAPDGEELRRAVVAAITAWKVGRTDIAVPVFAAAWRAVLGGADFSLFLAGPTGVFKSELAALAQQHFGAAMNARNLPADWSATENYLEGFAFSAKDTILVIDEFVPRGNGSDQNRYHAKADRVLRAQGNNSGRGRMRADATLRPVRNPRGLIVSTGEEIPQGQSLRARLLVLEVGPGDITSEKLTTCQQDAAAGRYAQAMSAFLTWLAPQYAAVRSGLSREVEALREETIRNANSEVHRRTADIVANLVVGLRYFLRFAADVGALTKADADRAYMFGWKAIARAAGKQSSHQQANEPTRRYLELIAEAVSSGRAHLSSPLGGPPQHHGADPAAFGWRKVSVGSYGAYDEEWRALGDRIGFVKGDDLYLIPDAAYQAAQRLASESGDGVAVRPATLHKRLHERGLIVSAEDGRQRHTVRLTVADTRLSVLHLLTSSVFPREPSQPSPVAHETGSDGDEELCDGGA